MNASRFTLLAFVFCFASWSSAQKTEITENIYFDTDKFDIRSLEKEKLEALWNKVKNDSLIAITLSGNTDSDAGQSYNLVLSKNRCLSVQQFLLDKGVSKDLIRIDYFGEDKPIAQNDNEEGKRQNRRVDIIIQLFRPNVSEVPCGTKSPIDNCIGVDTIIILKNGTELVFNKCEFLELQDCLEFKSIRNSDELIESGVGLNTVDDVPLVTCGMISICLSDKCDPGKKCFDQAVKVRFPYPNEANGECSSCLQGRVGLFNMTQSGTWEPRTDEKIEIVEVNGIKYYQLEIKCPNCGGLKNCDCPRCDTMDKRQRKISCPKVKLKLPVRYELIHAQIFVDCPPTIIHFEPDLTKKIVRRNMGKSRTMCYAGEHRIQALALDPKGDTIRMEIRPLSQIRHRIVFSKCKTDNRDNQRILGIFPGKSRSFYRKYKLRRKDLKS
ncbi:MAG: OmpA family protein [Bacteroidetes bacterium]|nr:MAG: OmpA family protein [Bacteroidota bacterium]